MIGNTLHALELEGTDRNHVSDAGLEPRNTAAHAVHDGWVSGVSDINVDATVARCDGIQRVCFAVSQESRQYRGVRSGTEPGFALNPALKNHALMVFSRHVERFDNGAQEMRRGISGSIDVLNQHRA